MATETIPFDASEFFADAEAQAALLTDAFESGDAQHIANALGIIAKAKGMTSVARECSPACVRPYPPVRQSGMMRGSRGEGRACRQSYHCWRSRRSSPCSS